MTKQLVSLTLCVVALVLYPSCATLPTEQSIKRARAFYRIGVRESNKGRFRQALAALTRAKELNPYDYWIREAMGGTLLRMQKPKLALTQYQKAVELQPKSPRGWNNLGSAHMAQGNYRQAIEAFKTSLKNILYQTPCFSQMNLGWAYHKLKQPEQAEQYLATATRTCPRLCQGHRMQGLVLHSNKKYSAAQQSFLELTKRCKKYPVGHYWLAKNHIAQKHFYAAVQSLRTCIKHSEKYPQVRGTCRQLMSRTQEQIRNAN